MDTGADEILAVREMTPDDVGVRIDYFHSASDDFLEMLGVDRARLPSRDEWHREFEADYGLPAAERKHFGLMWLIDAQIVGFGTLDKIRFGEEARMHLHVIEPLERKRGLGMQFVQQSVPVFFETFRLTRLYCEPNALNVAPNRTLQAAGFRYESSHFGTPGPINFPQVTTRWMQQVEMHQAE